ncbi:MAG: hypothetical protein D8M58_04200 [Calditrichaeota bacterium]|nr:MAG: hypothetical protein DWQ03_02875 [Calditrichota bacterium]MBL1204571.1 hypothetical protein [Calditrichota bacterium]NOG44400.1 hypothetical protein [Calditrichota bacterium]
MKITKYFIFSLALVLLTSVYQRMTGPTYAKKVTTTIADKSYDFKLTRSHEIGEPFLVEFEIPDTSVSAEVVFRRFPTNDEYQKKELTRNGNLLQAELPTQPAAGKLQYYLEFYEGENYVPLQKEEPVIIRFKGAVPSVVLIIHIVFMFAGMWFSNLTGLLAIVKNNKQKFYGILTLAFLIIGGMIMGPIVQKFAFNEYWAGIPFGWDLTDNKTLIAVVAWVIAVIGNWKKERRFLFIAAALITIAIFIIPHSMMGSEFDYVKGEVTTG